LGGVLFRAGKWEEAIRQLNEAIKAEGKGGTATDWLFLAMAHYRGGYAGEARKWLNKALAHLDRIEEEGAKEGAKASLPWNARLEMRLLRREAEALIKAPKP
jgi:hypothetical protein